MFGSRFFIKSRDIFGTPLLQMNSNTILSLCKSNRYNFSVKTNLQRSQQLNSLFDAINRSITGAEVSCLESAVEKESLIQNLNEETVRLNLVELVSKSMTSLMMKNIKTVGLNLGQAEPLAVIFN